MPSEFYGGMVAEGITETLGLLVLVRLVGVFLISYHIRDRTKSMVTNVRAPSILGSPHKAGLFLFRR